MAYLKNYFLMALEYINLAWFIVLLNQFFHNLHKLIF